MDERVKIEFIIKTRSIQSILSTF